jgi:hypothetical protein
VSLSDYNKGDKALYLSGVRAGELRERERIISNIYERISDLRSCTKKDNCVEFGELIEEYVFEWTEDKPNE